EGNPSPGSLIDDGLLRSLCRRTRCRALRQLQQLDENRVPSVRIREFQRIVQGVRIAVPPLRIDERLLDIKHWIDRGEAAIAAGVVAGAEVIEPRLAIALLPREPLLLRDVRQPRLRLLRVELLPERCVIVSA